VRRRAEVWAVGAQGGHVVVVDLREDVREEHRVPHLELAARIAPTNSNEHRAFT
jgi:hypothetical protein